MSTNEEPTCVKPVRFDSGYWAKSRPCGNPAKGTLMDGGAGCGIHIAAERKREQTVARRQEALNKSVKDDEYLKKLSDFAGFPVQAFYGVGGRSYDKVVIPRDVLIDLLKITAINGAKL